LLHLDLGAVNLNVLGLALTTQPISIDLSGQTSAGLGQLLCSISRRSAMWQVWWTC